MHPLFAQRAPNANASYQQLRGLLPGGETVNVKDSLLKRDAAEFTFHSGSFAFYGAVNGKVTGAVFKGQGHLHITPPTAEERHNLSLVAQTEEFDEDFDQVVLRFTDSTADELHKASTGAGQPDNAYAKAAEEHAPFCAITPKAVTMRSGHSFYYGKFYGNLDLRLLEDVLSPAPGGYFFAAIHGTKDSHLFFIFDPQGVDEVAPEEVALLQVGHDERHRDHSSRLPPRRRVRKRHGQRQRTQCGLQDPAPGLRRVHREERLPFKPATIEVEAEQEGVAVIPLDLYPTLRVSQVDFRQRRRARLGAGEQGPGSRISA